TVRPFTVTFACPVIATKKLSPGCPSFTTDAPSMKSAISASEPSFFRCRFESPSNRGTPASTLSSLGFAMVPPRYGPSSVGPEVHSLARVAPGEEAAPSQRDDHVGAGGYGSRSTGPPPEGRRCRGTHRGPAHRHH